ncbi:Cell division control protein 7, partial [Coemansia aciculifera]
MNAHAMQNSHSTKRSREATSPPQPSSIATSTGNITLYNSLGIPIVLPAPKRPRPLASATVPFVGISVANTDQAADTARQVISDGYESGGGGGGGFDEQLHLEGSGVEGGSDDDYEHNEAATASDNEAGNYSALDDNDYETNQEEEIEEEEAEENDGTDESDYNDDDLLDVDAESTLEEIEELESLIPGLADHYRLLGKIGQGTFSTVYKAVDLQHDRYDNSSWTMIFNSSDDNETSPTLPPDHGKPYGRRRK